jgi:predicted transglutaminase-like cysteine proteinase
MVGVAVLLAARDVLAFSDRLFGYRELPQERLADFPQWLNVLERHLEAGLAEGPCGTGRLNRCHIAEWRRFIAGLRGQSLRRQLTAVNAFANERDYVLDLDNYGLEDYWAIPREFLGQGGDCEDYVITKLLSLRWLGVPAEQVRLVVVQDTNLRVPHAVLAVSIDKSTLILDNQVSDVLTDRDVIHYAPVYSINETRWWMHLPVR